MNALICPKCGSKFRDVRSPESHSHFFACVNEAWANLPEEWAQEFPTAKALRKWCLIKANFCDKHSIVLSSRDEARRVAAFMRPIDECSVVTVHGCVVNVYVAKSQSKAAMGGKEFQRSKEAVLELISNMIGVEQEPLSEQARSSAAARSVS